jgi:hypothetical protein
LLKASEVVIGSNETRVSAINGKQSLFAIYLESLDESKQQEDTLF